MGLACSSKKISWFHRFIAAGVGLALLLAGGAIWLSQKYVVPILMYHQVEAIDHFSPNWVSPENFERQMAFLNDHGYKVISLGALIDATLAGRSLPRKSVVITFDDGYANNFTSAFPVLQKYQFPATLFMPSDRVGQKGYLNIDQLKEMAASGIEIGSHTRFETYLPDVPESQQHDEIVTSKEKLEQMLGIKVDYFAYPIGGFSERIKAMLREAGYKAACTTNRGSDRWNQDLYELKRIRLSDRDIRPDYLWTKLCGYYNLLRKFKKPY